MMDQPTLTCQDEQRRQAVRNKGRNGIDYVEVDDRDQHNLRVRLFGKAPEKIDKGSVRIEGGRRIRDILVTDVRTEGSPNGEADDCVLVMVDKAGDFSMYTLRFVEVKDGKPTDNPMTGFDPRYAKVQFSFKVGCPSDLDCKTEAVCPPEKRDEPEITYLAKDYASFRQLILDRLALIMPDWQERHVPDIGIALVEVLAYVGDYLSYYQDAVSTEAHLDTARQRISVRRHARLVDYQLHEGCNARAWICLETKDNVPLDLGDCYFITPTGDALSPGKTLLKHEELQSVPASRYEVFEPIEKKTVQLYVAHNDIPFYTWGDEECCLPCGATTATLKDEWLPEKQPEPKQPPSYKKTTQQQSTERCPPPDSTPPKPERELHLEEEDILIFEEVIGPKTGNPADADPSRRWAVRLTKVEQGVDPLNEQPIVEIEWAAEDALPFPFCLSARRSAPDCDLVPKISIARGNVLLVDHGKTVELPEDLGQVTRDRTVGQCACEGSALEMTAVPAVFRPPGMKQAPLTHREALPHGSPPASRLLKQDPRKALPQITLTGLPGVCAETGDMSEPKWREGIDPNDPQWLWHPQRDLLESRSQDQDFVVEMDNDSRAHLRFGDGELGRIPEACMIFTARYRVGNGPAGNVPADSITKIVCRNLLLSGATLRPRNPLPAQGGTAPEPMTEVKLFAPGAFRKELQRAITADDYARLAERNSKIQRAGASLRWTGSWYAAQVAVDPQGSETADNRLLKEIKGYLYCYRRMGHDLEVRQAHYIPLDIQLTVCVLPHFLRGHVEAALLDEFSNHQLPDGRLGFFHPDKLTFGTGIYLSTLVAAAQAVPGVESMQVTRLQRLFEGDNGELQAGILPLGPLEIAQLDNDPSSPENGKLNLDVRGGR
jgi:hypothetical protein